MSVESLVRGVLMMTHGIGDGVLVILHVTLGGGGDSHDAP